MPRFNDVSGFFGELKRRNVVRVAAVYAAVGFVVIEVVLAVFPALLFPEWLARAVVVLVLLGFPIALVIAWAFELTPQGVRRTDQEAVAGELAPGAHPSEPYSATASSSAGWFDVPTALLVAGFLVLGGAIWWFAGRSDGFAGPGSAAGTEPSATAAAAPTLHLSIALPEGDSIPLDGRGSAVAISPDGEQIAYVAVRRDTSRLYLRPLATSTAVEMPGTEGAQAPFFSPDGRWIGFYADGAVHKVAVEGGTPVRIVDFLFRGGSWGPGDRLFFGTLQPGGYRGISTVRASGGVTEPVTKVAGFVLDGPEQAHLRPSVLPGGDAILFTSWNAPGDMRVVLHELESGRSRVVLERGSRPRYLAGHLVYGWGGAILAVPFDAETGELRGDPVPILDGVATGSRGNAHFDVSTTGTLVRVSGTERERSLTFAWVDLEGRVQELPFEPGTYLGPRLAPDGRRFLASRHEGGHAIWLYDVDRGAARRLTEPRPQEFWPIWSPDGRSALHNSNRYGGPALDVYRRTLDGSRPMERLTEGPGNKQPRTWTSGGDTLIFTSGEGGVGDDDGETLFDIWLLPLSPAGPPVPWLRTPAQESHPVMSPDGRWIAYASDASGRAEVYVRRFPGPGGEVQVSTAGGREPVWSPEGDRIYYRDTSGDSLWVVPFETARNSSGGPPAPRPGRAELLLTGRFLGAASFAGRNYDIAPDGRRFLMILEAEDDEAAWMERTRIDVIVNWLPEMRRRTMSDESGPGDP